MKHILHLVPSWVTSSTVLSLGDTGALFGVFYLHLSNPVSANKEDFKTLCDCGKTHHTFRCLAFADYCHREADCIQIILVEHFKLQDYVKICTNFIPENKTCLKSSRLLWKRGSIGRSRFKSKSLTRSKDDVCWPFKVTRPIFCRPLQTFHNVENPLSRSKRGYNWALNRVMCSKLQTENARLNKS